MIMILFHVPWRLPYVIMGYILKPLAHHHRLVEILLLLITEEIVNPQVDQVIVCDNKQILLRLLLMSTLIYDRKECVEL